jgi:hypothetical protein
MAAQAIKVAQWCARGPHAGLVVPLRRVASHQRWHVRVTIEKPAVSGVDQRDVLRFDASAPCDLRAMHALVMGEIGQTLADGELVRDARMEFFVTPGRAGRMR